MPENTDPEVARKLEKHPGRIAFMERYGRLFQIEVDALPPEELVRLVSEAIGDYWNDDIYQAVIEREDEERLAL